MFRPDVPETRQAEAAMIAFLLGLIPIVLMLLPTVSKAAAPVADMPLTLTVRQTMGMAPLVLRVKVRAEAEGREVCVVVEGPESFQSCRTLYGVTWTLDFQLRQGGAYGVYATSQGYRTTELPVRVIGLGEGQ